MNLMKKTLATAIVLLAMSLAVYAAKYTTTITWFNVASVESFTLTLRGGSPVYAETTGNATSDIEFNSSAGTATCIDPCVVGGQCQDAGNAIFAIANTGTTNINVTANFTIAPPSCVSVGGSNVSRAAACTGLIISTTAVPVAYNLAPEASISWWEAANFTSCTGQATSRTQWVYGIQSTT